MKGENAGDKKHRYSATHQSTNRIKLFEEKCYILAFVVMWSEFPKISKWPEPPFQHFTDDTQCLLYICRRQLF